MTDPVIFGVEPHLFHVVDHEDDDAAGVEDEYGDDVDERVALHLPSLFTGQCGRISTKRSFKPVVPACFAWVELLRSKFKRSIRKLHFRLTENGLGLKVDIEDRASCRNSHLLTNTGLRLFV